MATAKPAAKKKPTTRKKKLTSETENGNIATNDTNDVSQEEHTMPENDTTATLNDSAEATVKKTGTRRKKFTDAEGYLLTGENGERVIDEKTGQPILVKPRELSPRTVAKKLRGAINIINATIAMGNAKGLHIELSLDQGQPDSPLVLGPIKLEETI